MNCLYVNYQFLILLLILTIIPLISWLVYKLSLINLKLYVANDNVIYVCGSDLDIEIWFRSRFGIKIPWCKCKTFMKYSNSTQQFESEVTFQGMREQQHNVVMNINLAHLGIAIIYVYEFEVRDYLGMFSKKIKFNTGTSYLIFPCDVEQFDSQTYYNYGEDQHTMSLLESDNTEVQDLRNIVEGDSMNHIHWKRSLMSEDLVVKQYGTEIKKNNYIIVDLSLYTDKNFRDTLDKIYAQAFNIANSFIDLEIDCTFLFWNNSRKQMESLNFNSRETFYEAMERLMGVQCAKNTFEPLMQAVFMEKSSLCEHMFVVTSKAYEIEGFEIINVLERN